MEYNLVYMARPIYGGWVTFTSHLSLKYNFPIFKIFDSKQKKILENLDIIQFILI